MEILKILYFSKKYLRVTSQNSVVNLAAQAGVRYSIDNPNCF